jgi:hydrogenase 3 maturation protease
MSATTMPSEAGATIDRWLSSLTERSLVVGIGHPSRADDAAGPELVRALTGRTRLRLLDVEEVPERYFGPIIEAAPDVILLCDAIDFGAQPGAVAVFSSDRLPERMSSTHDVALACVARFLAHESGATVLVLGIQPQTTAFGVEMTPAIRESVTAVARLLADRFPLEGSR